MKIHALVAALLFGVAGIVHAEEKVVVYNWAEYIPEGILDDFTKETGIKVPEEEVGDIHTVGELVKHLEGKRA